MELAKLEALQQPSESARTPVPPAIPTPSLKNIFWRVPRDEEQAPVVGESASKDIYPIEAALNASVIDFGKFQKWSEAQSTKNSMERKDSGHHQDSERVSEDDLEHSVQSSDEDGQEVTRSQISSTISSRHMLGKPNRKSPSMKV